MSLHGKVALITYGGRNPGVDMATELAREGAQLAIHYNSTKSQDIALVLREELKKSYPGRIVSVHAGDLRSATGVEHLFSEVLRTHQQLDVVVSLVCT